MDAKRALVRSGIAAAAILFLVADASAASYPAWTPAFSTPLNCATAGAPDLVPALDAALAAEEPGVLGQRDLNLQWGRAALKENGLAASIPATGAAGDFANRFFALLRLGHTVAAKVYLLHVKAFVRSFPGSELEVAASNLLTVITQPIDDEAGGASSVLREIMERADAAKKALGPLYSNPDVRLYILAAGFRDTAAFSALGARVCALRLDEATTGKINASTRFMAAPFRDELSGGKR